MSTTYGPTAPALTAARVTRLAKAAAPDLRWSSEKGARGILVRVWDAPQDGTDREELRLLNEARRLINATDLSATVVALRASRRTGRTQFRILVTSEAQESAAIQEQADKRAAALAAAAEEVKAAQEARATAELLASAPVLAARAASEAAWEEEAHAAGFATGDEYASFLTEDLPEPVEERVQAHIDAALAPQRASAAEGFPAEEEAPQTGTEYVVFCPNHQHYLVRASAGGTTWTDSQEQARRYTKKEARQQAESATWVGHNPTAWALPSSGPAELELSEQARRTISAMREERERLEGLSPAPEKGYPPVTVAECEEALAEGIAFILDGASGHSVEVVERRSGARLGRVRCLTEELGGGFWVHFAAYRPDGSRVGHAKGRVAAALLLRPEVELTPAVVTLTNPELWG
jgi:hypothetical protein